jgi:hypothetical protein
MLSANIVLTTLRFSHWHFYISVILPSYINWISPLLNLIGVLVVNYSRSLAINLALYSLLYSAFAKVLSVKNSVSLVCRLMILKGLLL